MCHEKLPLFFCPGVFRLAARDARRKHFVYGDYRIDFGRRWHHLYGVQLHLSLHETGDQTRKMNKTSEPLSSPASTAKNFR